MKKERGEGGLFVAGNDCLNVFFFVGEQEREKGRESVSEVPQGRKKQTHKAERGEKEREIKRAKEMNREKEKL